MDKMKQEYESPTMEIVFFEVKDAVMDSGGGCGAGYNGAVCPYNTSCDVDVSSL